jgi:hypothetical protein
VLLVQVVLARQVLALLPALVLLPLVLAQPPRARAQPPPLRWAA